ncbi:MAG: hypothetical protein CVU56_03760 [Deltaproteobacteria bacterium HGW-Deltaproteobacteria-14]|jgi:superfamily I DNA/RNA helicase|nr:MAG: hypothetical protein CVU56_03760 [Deltaproteobacteria bacterium HGW-Deltaproteobacteria-14]
MVSADSHNFGFLAPFDPGLFKEALDGERSFAQLRSFDLAVVAYRRFVERLTEAALVRAGRPGQLYKETLQERMARLEDTGSVPPMVVGWLAEARQLGNKGSHVGFKSCTDRDAVEMMRLARKLAVWWVGEIAPDAELKVPGFRVPQTGDAGLDARNDALAREAEASVPPPPPRARLVVHGGLTAAYEELGAAQRQGLARVVEALRVDALDPAWPHASIAGVDDDKLRAVVIDDGVSLVTAVPAGGDVVFALWACAPAEVSGWARHKRVEVHPAIGTVQLYDVAVAEAAVADEGGDAAEDEGAASLFAPYADADLTRLGVPSPLLPAVRAVMDEAAFRRLAPLLPGEAGDALELLLAADSVAEVVAALALGEGEVDVRDFDVAVEHPASQRTFRLVAPDEDLEAALSGSIAAWRLFLHPDQQALVGMDASGPVRVLGGAGTGKTVALLHRAAHLLREVVRDGEVLVTTYTRNLATDLERSLGQLVDGEAMKRARVMNLHRLARRIGQTGRYGGTELLQADGAARLWDGALVFEALGLVRAFYEAEWREVVQAQGVTDAAGYLRVSRRGRGVALGRQQRRAVWRVFEAYTRLKDERKLVEWPDLVRHARERIEAGEWTSPFVAVLADEVQDFTPEELRLLRALAPAGRNDLFLVGDAHQRIYGTRTSMRACGIAVTGRSRRLRVNYRTTEEIRELGVRVLAGLEFDDLDGGVDTLAGYRSLRSGLAPRVVRAADRAGEADAIVVVLGDWLARYPAEALCVAARTGALVRRYRDLLEQRGVATVTITQEEPAGPGVRVATMHRLKGLEFSCVLLAAMHESAVTFVGDANADGDVATQEERELSERALLYVAATRARDELVLTAVGATIPWLTLG